MYYICVPGLGYIHKRWRGNEPRFSTDLTQAKSWKLPSNAMKFGQKELATRAQLRWELWQDIDNELVPIIRPHSV